MPEMTNDYASSLKAALARAAALCDRQETCSAEILAKLAKWGLEPDSARKVLDKLRELSYVDDRRYARTFAHHKMAYSGWGRYKIANALTLKGIGREITREALESLDMEEYMAVAEKVVRSKVRLLKDGIDTYENRLKVMRFATGRGFESSLVSQVLRDIQAAEK